jgi:hypothetical protein
MTEEARQAVLELAERHYGGSDEPLYLAGVGQELRSRKLWPIEGEKRSLKEWLKTLEPDITVLQDETTPARVAIVTSAKAQRVDEILLGLRNAEFLATLARPVLLAFCVRGTEAGPVFITRRPPFKYTLVPPQDGANYHVVPPEFRLPGLRLATAGKMAPSDVVQLGANIQRWAGAHAVDLGSLTREVASAEQPVAEEVAIGTMSALDRLIAAQRPDLRTQVVIPADIAALLSRHK